MSEEADERLLVRLAGSDDEFLATCGAVGLGRLVAEGQLHHLARLRALASDARWRVREGVAMALQRWGDDFDAMASEAERWAQGSPLEQRAAIAGLCEPRLLRSPEAARRTLGGLERPGRRLGRAREPEEGPPGPAERMTAS